MTPCRRGGAWPLATMSRRCPLVELKQRFVNVCAWQHGQRLFQPRVAVGTGQPHLAGEKEGWAWGSPRVTARSGGSWSRGGHHGVTQSQNTAQGPQVPSGHWMRLMCDVAVTPQLRPRNTSAADVEIRARWMDKEQAGWPRPDCYSQHLLVQMETSNVWCPSRVCAGTSAIQYLHRLTSTAGSRAPSAGRR